MYRAVEHTVDLRFSARLSKTLIRVPGPSCVPSGRYGCLFETIDAILDSHGQGGSRRGQGCFQDRMQEGDDAS